MSSYLSTRDASEREEVARELSRFTRWIGSDVPVGDLTPTQVARYQEHLPESSSDINRRLELVKTFLAYLKGQKLTRTNLGVHIRIRRPSSRSGPDRDAQAVGEAVRITEEGHARLSQELEHLEGTVRPRVTEDLQRAYADKDFRENAPYDAAKQHLSEVQSRINDIRRTLSAASIYFSQSTDVVDLGTIVTLHSLDEDEQVTYTVVGPGEVSPREGKISAQSPVGSALVNRRVGEVVEVQTPAGTHTYRIDKIERR